MNSLDVYAIKDLEKGKFATPYFVPEGTEEKEVIIDFKNYLQKGVMQLFLDPANYELYKIGNFDLIYGCFQHELVNKGDKSQVNRLVIAGADLTGVKVPEERKITVDLENDGKSN